MQCFFVNLIFFFFHKFNRQEDDAKRELSYCDYMRNDCILKIDINKVKATIITHSPYEVYSDIMKGYVMELDTYSGCVCQVLEIRVDESLRMLSAKQRKCLFHDEGINPTEIYSFRLCQQNCKARAALSMCGCKPFYYLNTNGPNCTPEGFVCLKEMNWTVHYLNNCDCFKPCTDLIYMIQNAWLKSYGTMDGMPYVSKSTYKWDITQIRYRYHRDLMFSFENVLGKYFIL